MKNVYAFDVDGTLTNPREPIDPTFNEFFYEFARNNIVYLVTGSDAAKIDEQLPAETIAACKGLFSCSGAEFWDAQGLVYRKEHTFPKSLVQVAENFIDTSQYPHRFGNHIEPRPGMLNISVVGRNATLEQRKHYHVWDATRLERQEFVEIITQEFPAYEASTGGEISIDIVPKGWTKAVAKSEIENRHPNCAIMFFGDRMTAGGNDKPLADALRVDAKHRAISVEGFEDTWRELISETRRRAA